MLLHTNSFSHFLANVGVDGFNEMEVKLPSVAELSVLLPRLGLRLPLLSTDSIFNGDTDASDKGMEEDEELWEDLERFSSFVSSSKKFTHNSAKLSPSTSAGGFDTAVFTIFLNIVPTACRNPIVPTFKPHATF